VILARGEALGVDRSGKSLLDDVTLDLRAGELTVVVGPNGAGKSTLLRVLSGEIAPTRGCVTMFGEPLAGWEPRALARRRAVVAQHVNVAFPWAVWDLVALGRLPHDAGNESRIIDAALAQVGMTAFARRSSAELSGGEMQRVHLARAIAQLHGTEAALLLLDEPTASLDPAHQHETLRLARAMARAGHAVLCILHDLALAARYADRALVLDRGTCVGQGAAAEVLAPALLAKVFKIRTMRHTDPASGEDSLFVLGPLAEEEPTQ
jgi:iron complex transport system ATP-binding protein